MRTAIVVAVIAALFVVPAAPPAEAAAAGGLGRGRIVFAAARGDQGALDIFSTDLAGTRAANLTADPEPDRSPSWSPDAERIVFASRRGDNWDLYLMRADGSERHRLTDHPAYDGEPAWSPDGRRIAFTSSREGSLDIFLLDLAGGAVRRLTDDSAADSQPAWSPDGREVVFTSWRDGNQEIYRVAADGGSASNISDHPAPDHSPAWSPDGRRVAFISDRDGGGNLHVLNLATRALEQAGPSNLGLSDPSWTPTGGLVAAGPWVTRGRRFAARNGVLIAAPGAPGITFVVAGPHAFSEPEWSSRAVAPALPEARYSEGRILQTTVAAPDIETLPTGFVRLEGVESGGMTQLAAAVKPSFDALRQAVIDASGRDFLGVLAEASRPIEFRSGTSSYASWHKAGRAFDTRFDYRVGGEQVLYIAPEWRAGRLFWRLHLRAARQDGSQGQPLAGPVFSVSSRSLLPPPRGYFVDFTALAAAHGWGRIAAQERETFDWRSQPLALEYWHFERRDGLTWYDAMSLVHSERTLARLFSEEALLAAGTRPGFIPSLGLPWVAVPPPLPAGQIILRPGQPS